MELPKSKPDPVSQLDDKLFTESFLQFAVSCGYTLDTVIPDGKIHRFNLPGRKKDFAGWYIFYNDKHPAGVIGDWVSGESYKYNGSGHKSLSDADKQAIKTRRSEYQESEQKRHKIGQQRAELIWQQAKPAASSHPYLIKKKIKSHGIRQTTDDRLVISGYGAGRIIQTLQFIGGNGEKRFLAGAKKAGACFWIKGSDRYSICEGYATGASIHEATGWTVIVAFDAGNILPVAETIRAARPDIHLTICADNDRHTAGNPGLTKARIAAEKIGKASVVYPRFKDPSSGTDFNDLAIAEGIEAVRQQLTNSESTETPLKTVVEPFTENQTRVFGRVINRPPEPEYLIYFKDKGLFTRGVVGSFSAAGGSGKTRLLTQLVCGLSSGTPYAYFSSPKPIRILLLVAEEPQDELDRRLWDACGGKFSPNLFALSIKGLVGPLMYLDGNEPKCSEWYFWLDETIQKHHIDLLVLDPKSRLYGLNELDNDHNTQWVASLDALTLKHNISIIFTHHVPKNTNTISQWMARGGGALIDACRCNLGMVRVEESEGNKYGLDDWWNYVKIGVAKTNIGPNNRGDAYLKFDDKGLLHPVNLYDERIRTFKNHFLFLLSREEKQFSRRDLEKGKCASELMEEMKSACPNFTRRGDTQDVINALIDDGALKEVEVSTGGPKKFVLQVVGRK